MTRYRRQIRADLAQHFGVDLAAWVAAHRTRALLDLIDSLPSASRTNEAILDDPDQVPLIVARIREREREEGKQPWRPDLSEWSLQHELLASIRDVLLTANSAKPKSVKAFPRPVNAVETERARTEAAHLEQQTRATVAALTPWAVA